MSATQQANTMVCKKHGIPMERQEHSFPGMPPREYFFCDLCESESEVEEQERAKAKQAEEDRERVWRGVPKHFVGASISQFSSIEPVLKWIKNPQGFIFVHGACGAGKTHLAAAVKRYFNESGTPADFLFSSDVFLTLRNTFSKNPGDESELRVIRKYSPNPDELAELTGPTPQYMRRISPEQAKPHIAIFDDIGAQKISEYAIEAWYNIIDRRYRFELPTMFTSNLSLKEISLYMTDRIASRIAGGVVFQLNGPDRRLSKGR